VLLTRDPRDLTTKIIRARALRNLGQTDAARAAAKDACQQAKTDEDKYAMVMAQVQSSSGHKTIAQRWLRRAIEIAPEEHLERRAIRDCKYVRATNPWSTRLSFSIAPDSNIDNGSSPRSSFLNYRQIELLFGEPLEYTLDGPAPVLSGVEYAFGLQTQYRFHQTAARAHDLFFSIDLRRYTFSSDAKDQAPDVSGSDFTFSSYQLGYGYRQFTHEGRGEIALRADVDQSWYGGEEYVRFACTSALQSYGLKPTTRINRQISGERQYGLFTNDLDKIVYMGFNPTMTLDGSVTGSNIGLYEAERFGVNFGIQSAFRSGFPQPASRHIRPGDYSNAETTREGARRCPPVISIPWSASKT